MWLLDTSKYTLTQTLYPEKYAILSHTWEDGEVTFQDIKDPAVASQKAGWVKIVQTCRLAKGQGFDRVWIDTCCIDKSSSAELSEAINSMFQWYKNADVCYVWLSDLPRAPDGPNSQASQNQLERDLPRCRWFTRGWTLQELIAPRNIKFYDRGWVMRGTKLTLVAQLADITNIAFLLLYNMSELYEYPVARRMSWAAKRQTTRLEDAAYCLLGIFEVNMPMIYGEGERAFQRLQEAIALSSNDMSLFAWSGGPGAAMPFHGIIARSPSQFAQCTKIVNNYEPLHYDSRSFAITNRGVEFKTSLAVSASGGHYLMPLHCWDSSSTLVKDSAPSSLVVPLLKTPNGFIRHGSKELTYNKDPDVRYIYPGSILVRKDAPIAAYPRINSRYHNSFKFNVIPSPRWTCELATGWTSAEPQVTLQQKQDPQAALPSYWDPATSAFMTDSHHAFTGLLYISFSSAGAKSSTISPLFLFCGFRRPQEAPPIRWPGALKNPYLKFSYSLQPFYTLMGRPPWRSSDERTHGSLVDELNDTAPNRYSMDYAHYLQGTGNVLREKQDLPVVMTHPSMGLSVSLSMSKVTEGNDTIHKITIFLNEV